jgi:hypothetical protein
MSTYERYKAQWYLHALPAETSGNLIPPTEGRSCESLSAYHLLP